MTVYFIDNNVQHASPNTIVDIKCVTDNFRAFITVSNAGVG